MMSVESEEEYHSTECKKPPGAMKRVMHPGNVTTRSKPYPRAKRISKPENSKSRVDEITDAVARKPMPPPRVFETLNRGRTIINFWDPEFDPEQVCEALKANESQEYINPGSVLTASEPQLDESMQNAKKANESQESMNPGSEPQLDKSMQNASNANECQKSMNLGSEPTVPEPQLDNEMQETLQSKESLWLKRG